MDNFILIETVSAFMVFLPVHVIVLRQISDRSVIPVFWMTYVVVGIIIQIFFGFFLLSGYQNTIYGFCDRCFMVTVYTPRWQLFYGNFWPHGILDPYAGVGRSGSSGERRFVNENASHPVQSYEDCR